jgi:hypothetical protein
MKRAIIALASIALLAACGSPRKACRRAEGFIQKAVRICPEAAQLRTDTVTITVPGDSVTLEAAYIQPDRDSLRAVIIQLSEALQAERELASIDVAAAKARTRRSLDRVRTLVCYHAPVTIDGETARGIMWVDSTGTPRGKCWCKPQRHTAEVTTPQVIAGDVQVKGGNPWLVWLLCAAFVATTILAAYLWLRMDDWRYKYNQTKRP